MAAPFHDNSWFRSGGFKTFLLHESSKYLV